MRWDRAACVLFFVSMMPWYSLKAVPPPLEAGGSLMQALMANDM
jgi:hypothetical protein